MVTEKRLIDANALSNFNSGIDKDMKRPGAVKLACLCLIADAPTVDAVEVVWCKDCIWFDTEDELADVYRQERHCFCTEVNGYVSENHFCSYGERKDNG